MKLSSDAKLEGNIVRCGAHGRKLAIITDKGIELWCRGIKGGHPVILTFEQIESWKVNSVETESPRTHR